MPNNEAEQREPSRAFDAPDTSESPTSPPTPEVPPGVAEALSRMGVEVPVPMLASLSRFLDLIEDYNRHTNLTAIREREAAWHRLIVDSLSVLFLLDPEASPIPEGGRVIDVGTGGGLPGIPLAICRPDLRFTLVDSVGKKTRFCTKAAAALGLSNVRVVQGRAETLGHEKGHRQGYDAAVCRAVGPMAVLLELCLPLVRVGGSLLAMKGPRLADELKDAGDALTVLGAGEVQVFDAYPEGFDNDLVIARIAKAAATPKTYPRAPGVPKAQPL